MSPIDRVVAWGTRQRAPGWVLAFALALVIAVVFNAVKWADGSLALGRFGYFTVSAFYVPYALSAYGATSRAADAAFLRFKPSLAVSSDEFKALRKRFAFTTPLRMWVPFGIGATFAAVTSAQPGEMRTELTTSPATLVVVGVFGLMAGWGLSFFLVLRMITLLFDVAALHRRVAHVDLFRREPAHAFAPVTAGAVAVLIGLVAFSTASDPTAFKDPATIVLNVGAMGVAVVAFFIPLLGMRNRLRQGKALMLDAAVARLRGAVGDFEAAVDKRQYAEAGLLKDVVLALEQEATRVRQASTWPWEPRTLRAFSSALLLPVVTWLITASVGRLLDL